MLICVLMSVLLEDWVILQSKTIMDEGCYEWRRECGNGIDLDRELGLSSTGEWTAGILPEFSKEYEFFSCRGG